MGWVNDAMVELKAGRSIQVQAMGGSMRGRIESRQLVTLSPVGTRVLQVDDIVLVRWRENYLLHLIQSIYGESLLIANSLGKVNGTVNRSDVLGVATAICNEPTATATVIEPVRQGVRPTFRVRLDHDPRESACNSGQPDCQTKDLVAFVGKAMTRHLGRIQPGCRVVVAGIWNAKYQIRGLASACQSTRTD